MCAKSIYFSRVLVLALTSVTIAAGVPFGYDNDGAETAESSIVMGIVDNTQPTQCMEIIFDAVFKYEEKTKTDAAMKVEYDSKTYPMLVKGDHYVASVYAQRLKNNQPYTLYADYAGKEYRKSGKVDVDLIELVINYESDIDSASNIAIRDLNQAKTVKCGCLTVQPQAIGGSYDGVWLTDSGESYEALRYWADNDYVRDYLYKTIDGEKGLIEFFAHYQETEGEHAGNLAEAIYGDPKHHWDKDRTIDYGGAFDLAYSPRKNYRDLGNSVYIFCNYWYWKDFDDEYFITKYYDVMKRFLQYHLTRQDTGTGLIKSTYMIDHCDVCIDYAYPNSCSIFTVNALLSTAMQQFSEMAAAIGNHKDSLYYAKTAKDIKHAINTYLWNDENNRYEIKIFQNVTADASSPAYGISEDHYFFPASHGRFLDDWGNYGWIIPDSPGRIAKIINSIEEAQQGIKIYAPMVFPAYPDGWHNKIFEGGRYCNGDCWTQFGSRYLGALFNLGYPAIAFKGLKNLADVAVRDDCFYEFYEDNQEGTGKGVSKNNWANSRYLHALVKGLFGLQADYPNNILYIHPSLLRSGRIKCRLGMHGIDMQIDVDKTTGSKNLAIKTTYSGPADFRILIENSVTSGRVIKNETTSLSCDVNKIGDASYIVFRDMLTVGVNTFNLLLKY